MLLSVNWLISENRIHKRLKTKPAYASSSAKVDTVLFNLIPRGWKIPADSFRGDRMNHHHHRAAPIRLASIKNRRKFKKKAYHKQHTTGFFTRVSQFQYTQVEATCSSIRINSSQLWHVELGRLGDQARVWPGQVADKKIPFCQPPSSPDHNQPSHATVETPLASLWQAQLFEYIQLFELYCYYCPYCYNVTMSIKYAIVVRLCRNNPGVGWNRKRNYLVRFWQRFFPCVSFRLITYLVCCWFLFHARFA